MSRKNLLTMIAALALGSSLMFSQVRAAPPCGHTACSDEVAAAGLSGGARSRCFKEAKSQCEAGVCSCTGSPACVCVPDGAGCLCGSPSGAFLD